VIGRLSNAYPSEPQRSVSLPRALSISVIVPHLNQPRALAQCLAALAGQTGAFELAEVIVVDNGSKLLPQRLCDGFPKTRLLTEPTPGPGPARNTGAAAAGGAILAFVDADCIAGADWLDTITRTLAANPGVGILGGAVKVPHIEGQPATALEAYERIYAYRIDEYISRHGFAGTGNLAVRREVFAAVGPFGGITISEDRDWGLRAKALGHVIRYAPVYGGRSPCPHFVRGTAPQVGPPHCPRIRRITQPAVLAAAHLGARGRRCRVALGRNPETGPDRAAQGAT